MPNEAEQAIYSRLASAPSFHPASAELLLNDWTLEPGDVVTVKSGSQSYNLPIYSLNLNWNGSNLGGAENSSTTRITIESTGNKEREPLPALRRREYAAASKSYGGYGSLKEQTEEGFRRFETFYTQTDEKFNWLATEAEWDELAQEGHVTAFTELTRTARYVEDSAKMELPFEDWKGQWLVAHPEDSELTDPELQEKYNAWIAENPYAIYNTEYSDATRTERIISKTGIDSLGENETVLSRITQEADRVESSVYASQSQVYSAIGQTASNIRVELTNTEQNLYNYINMTASGIRQQITNAGNRTIVNDTDPRGATYTPKDGDIWIESVHDGTWDGADGFDWEHDEDYDWTQVQGAKAWVWKNDQWQLVADRQQLVTYSDFVNTADILISQKISELANEQGQVEVYRSLIEQSAEQIRAEVYGATSNIYTYIHQTASSISFAAGQRPTTVVQNSHTDGTPTSINGRGLKENDIWIDTADQTSWDAALDYNWDDDINYNWNDLRSDKIYVYRNGAWQLAVDGTILAEDTDLQVERDRIALLARNIDTLDGYARENFAQVNVRANEIYSEVLDKTNNLGSRITQTATQIRSEVHAANSQIYSEIVQTASNILLHVENAVSDMGATLEVTAERIRSDVYAAESTLYTSITQTASSIRSEVASTTSDLYSSITQTASEIRSEVTAAESTIYSSITQTASQISLKVSKGDISSTINQTAQSVLISASKINLEGYVTAKELSAEVAKFDNLVAGNTKATTLKASYIYGDQVFYNGDTLGGAIRSCSASSSEGVLTLTFTKYNTDTLDVNFNMADTDCFKDAVSAARASSLSTITLADTDTGESTQTVTVYSDDDEEIDLDTTVDASAVYEAGKTIARASSLSTITLADTDTGESTQTVTVYSDDDEEIDLDTTVDASAVYSAGWAAALAQEVEMPSEGTGTTFTVKVPSATEGEQETKTFTIQKDATPSSSGYAYVALDNTVVGRIDIGNWYSSGKSAGISSVSALIVNGNNDAVSGRHTLSSGNSITVYPATYVNGTTTRNNNAALVIIAGTTTITVDGWGITAAAGGGTKVNVNVNGKLYSHTFNNYP